MESSRAPLVLLVLAARAAHALSSTRIMNVAIPLPSGRELELCEGLQDAADGESMESLDELFSVGGTLWPCAAALCRWMNDNSEKQVQGKRILELGGGTGACGLYAAAMGAARVVLTDSTPRLIRLMENNCERNERAGNLPGLATSSLDLSFEQFTWNSEPPPSGPWDLIIGSDCTYEFDEDAHADLAATLSALLPRSGSSSAPKVVLAHQHRNRAAGAQVQRWDDQDEPLQRFLDALGRQQLGASQLVWERPEEGGSGNELVPMEGEDEISIIEVVRRAE